MSWSAALSCGERSLSLRQALDRAQRRVLRLCTWFAGKLSLWPRALELPRLDDFLEPELSAVAYAGRCPVTADVGSLPSQSYCRFPACFESLYQVTVARPPIETTPGIFFVHIA